MYKAANRAGQTMEGVIEATDQKEVMNALRSKSLYLLSVTEVKSKSSLDIPIGTGKIKKRVLSVFCAQFESLLKAGVPLVQALNILEEQTTDARLKAIVSSIADDLQRGRGLSEALGAHEGPLPSLMVKMIEAGEISGTLDSALGRLSMTLDREHKISKKIRGAMTYPIIVGSLCVIVIVLMLVFIIPEFTKNFASMEDLPGITRAMMSMSDFVKEKWPLLLAGLGLIIAAFKIFKGTEKGGMALDKIKYKLPMLKKTVKWVLAARFSRTLSTLTATGIPLTQALRIASKVVSNRHASNLINEIEDQIKQGQALNAAMASVRLFPPLLVQMTKIGEEAGTLDQMLERTAEYFEEESETTITRLVTILQPIMLVIAAGFVLLVILAVLLPMLSRYSQF